MGMDFFVILNEGDKSKYNIPFPWRSSAGVFKLAERTQEF
jgi:hypothetical protein